MPFKYTRKTSRASWTLENMNRAVNAVKDGLGIRRAGKMYDIPYGTLQDRLRGKVPINKKKLGRSSVLTAEQEKELNDYVLEMSKVFYGLTRQQIMKLAFQYATVNGIPKNFNEEKKTCGKDWHYGFLRRNKNISLRKPEPTSLNRVTGFNANEVAVFFSNITKEYEKFNFPPNRIYNVDETGVTHVHVLGRVLAPKGQKQVGALTSGERGKLVTVICAMSAAGDYVPPMFIFGRARMKYELTKNGPVNSIYKTSKNGWVNEELFYDWLVHFAKHTKCSINDRVLLIMDNHSSHCTLKVFNFSKSNGISIVTLPPHTSHRLQPLDVCFYGPLKTAYNQECDNFIRTKQYQKIDQTDVAELFKKAFNKTATIEKSVKGFETTGIYPLNQNVISAEEFVHMEEIEEEEEENQNCRKNEMPNEIKKSVRKAKKGEITKISEKDLLEAGPSKKDTSQKARRKNSTSSDSDDSANDLEEHTDSNESDDGDKTVSANISFVELMPVPRVLRSLKPSNRKKQHSQIFTVTPNKEELEIRENIRKKREEALNKSKKVKRNLGEDSQQCTIQKAKKEKKVQEIAIMRGFQIVGCFWTTWSDLPNYVVDFIRHIAQNRPK